MTTTVVQRFPDGPPIAVERLLAEARATTPLEVGDERVRVFLTALSRRLLSPQVTRQHPELGALGFFLRRGEVTRLLEGLEDELRFPRGLVFHIPPANVDTVFVYSWALSALAGNTNVVRLSARGGGATDTILHALQDTLGEVDPVIGQTQRLIGYDRSDPITAALSAGCGLRVIWGGDASIDAIRRHPLRPWARDLTFPDRSSFAAVSVAGWRAADRERRRMAADGFVTDAYWFDQAACSSPRTIFWVGEPADGTQAREEFEELVAAAVAARGFTVDAAMAVEKHVATYGMAASGSATTVRFRGNALATVELSDPGLLPRRWLGAGTFAHGTVRTLQDLVPYVDRKDQTLSVFGFPPAELRDFARAVGGRGIDRIVPFGSALAFAAVWDGYDLLREFTRLTTLTGL